jgi:hypothetical protein
MMNQLHIRFQPYKFFVDILSQLDDKSSKQALKLFSVKWLFRILLDIFALDTDITSVNKTCYNAPLIAQRSYVGGIR